MNNTPVYQSTTDNNITISVYEKQSEDRRVLDIFSDKIIIPNSYIIVVSSESGFKFYTTFHNMEKFDDFEQICESTYVSKRDPDDIKSCVVCDSTNQTYRIPCVEGEPLQEICQDCLQEILNEIQNIPAHSLVIPKL